MQRGKWVPPAHPGRWNRAVGEKGERNGLFATLTGQPEYCLANRGIDLRRRRLATACREQDEFLHSVREMHCEHPCHPISVSVAHHGLCSVHSFGFEHGDNVSRVVAQARVKTTECRALDAAWLQRQGAIPGFGQCTR